ncbi:MAG: vanadium-dependent haloperoxidase [Phormidesmis sp.]
MSDRRQEAYAVRCEAAELARSREHAVHRANGDEQRYADEQYFMSFTKGLPHNPDTGLLEEPQDFVEFRRAIDEGFIDPFSDRVRHGAEYEVVSVAYRYDVQQVTPPDNFRQWEAPTAGVVFDLEGPDAQAVTMPPAPPLVDAGGQVNLELIFEMAEVYELANLRDQPLNAFETSAGTDTGNPDVAAAIARLNALGYTSRSTGGRPRKVDSAGQLDAQTVFRGSSPGVEVGPYLSQFLLIGNTESHLSLVGSEDSSNNGGNIAEGQINYGILHIDQKVPIADPGKDYMITMSDYVKVQRGLKPEEEKYLAEPNSPTGSSSRPARRFISTPRDLATYVHYDALYEAYLNACLTLLGMNTPFDPGFNHLSGGGAAPERKIARRNASGFALYGGPHILTLVTEVATRALKAVRFQKFNNHIRLRPEALAARIELARLVENSGSLPENATVPPSIATHIEAFRQALQSNNGTASESTLSAVMNGPGEGTALLPMAFPEGSPMHPAYGAGHATVAGACVTILKAFFDTSAVLAKTNDGGVFRRQQRDDTPVAFRAPAISNNVIPKGNLEAFYPSKFLTLEGELNKLAANISIGRNMAGVHYFSDYYDSLRMGEKIAIGMLEEQALSYPTDPFVLSVPTFDGDVVRIGRR